MSSKTTATARRVPEKSEWRPFSARGWSTNSAYSSSWPRITARRQPRTEPVCFDGQYFIVTPETGAKIAGWLGGVADSKAPPAGRSEPLTWAERVDQLLKARCAGLMPEQKAQVAARLKEIAGTANYRTVTDEGTLMAIYNAFKEESA